jgi:beta-lactamase class C
LTIRADRRRLLLACGSLAAGGVHAMGRDPAAIVRDQVDATVRGVMERNDVPGMAVGITVRGRRSFSYHGVAARNTGRRVDEDTLFEIGSLSKTFTAALGSYARELGALSLHDPAGLHWSALAGSPIADARLLDLATYTAGGLPLQFPDAVGDEAAMLAYFREWQPAFPATTQRVYSNPSIGLFGHLAARSLGKPFRELMQTRLFPALRLSRTYLQVPANRMDDYAWGHARDGRQVRVNPGVFDDEAYGVKTTATDLLRFVEAQMGKASLDAGWQEALAGTQAGHYEVGPMVQGLGWEMYPETASLDRLLEGNASDMALKPQPAMKRVPPRSPGGNILVNKTGSTNGFGAYAAFLPARQVGIVLLANRNYPNAERVRAAHRILQALD